MRYLLLLLSFNLYATDWYQIKQAPMLHKKHTIDMNGKSQVVASYTYLVDSKAPTVTTVHGYLVNCHYLQSIHEFLTTNGFNVTCFELPGLGQSGGRKAFIEDFKDYRFFMNSLKKLSPNSNYLIVHSTGAVGLLDELFAGNTLPYKHTIMITPLVRNYKYWWTKVGHNIGRFIINGVSRNQEKEFESKELEWLHRNDPFFPKKTPLNWVGKLIKWNKKIENENPINNFLDLTFIYGSEDKIVDTPYNKSFLEKRLPKAQHIVIDGGTHYPFYDPKVKDKVLNLILTKLK